MAPVVEMVVHPFAARVVGQASRRGLIPRVPTAERLLTDVEAWLTAGYADLVRSTQRSTPADGEARLEVSLHPAARNLVITATDAGRVAAEAETVAARSGLSPAHRAGPRADGDGPVDLLGPGRPGPSRRDR